MTDWKLVTVWCHYHRQLELPRERTWWHRTLDNLWGYAGLVALIIVTVAVIVTLILFSPPPAGAHSPDEVEAWEADWETRFNDTIETHGLRLEVITPLIAERIDWVQRHHSHYFPEDAPDASPAGSQPTTASHQGMGSGVEQWRPLVTAYFGAGKADTALCLMSYESGGNPNAKNPRSSASGLFQLLAQWHDYFGIDPFNPEQNISAAAQLQAMYGWSQWSPYNRGLCR